MYRREGRYLLRTNLTETDPAALWQLYIKLTEVEAAFKNLKGDLRYARSSINKTTASRRTSSSPSSLTACTSPSVAGCTPSRRA